ncbi:CHAT domain-containing protein [Streptomyces sp. ST1015]|uniref:CHAT domain-containing protein n=1 Tax=Streptomyces sp. ST1015 TaxID=1848900 RepID=UPI001CA61F8D|nr:CHAT domain-containing protein [Streptomyces sp. ST1015]QZZ25466.1 CHAT domain-containing protein [Streptomyces sp. ST1015]
MYDFSDREWENMMALLAQKARGGTPDAARAAWLLKSFEAHAVREADQHESRFHRTKNPDALELAMKGMSRASLCAIRSGNREHSLTYGMEIGRLYATRFAHLGVWDDVAHAIASMRTVIAQMPPGDPTVAGCLVQLGVTLESAQEHMLSVYGPNCGTENVDAAIVELRKARQLIDEGTSPPDEDLPGTVLTHLGHCLLSRSLVQTDADAAERDLTEALELFDQATALLGDKGDSPDQPLTSGWRTPSRAQVVSMLRLYRLQGRLLRTVADGDTTGLEAAITAVRERMRTGNDPLSLSQWQVLLGGAQVFASLLAGRTSADPPVLAALSAAAAGSTGSEGPQRSIRTARLAATVALGQRDWAKAAALLRESLGQIHAQRGHGIPDSARLAWLGQGRDLTGDLVSCLVALGQAREAVVAFEEHRAVLLSEILGDRADTAGLDRVAPDLARAYRSAARELGRFEKSPDAHRPDHLARRRRLLRERDRVAERIRTVRGFERFGQAPRYADLAMGEGEGPTVLLNAGSVRGDALVLQDGEVDVVPLPRMRWDRLESAVGDLHRALRTGEQVLARRDGTAYVRQQRAIGEVLEQLWDWVAAPVWERIGAGGTPAEDAPRRIWWVPSGPLWFLPLHTASAVGGPSLADLAVSSYVPTVRMLKLARRRAPGGLRGPLVVSVPDAPGAAPLRGADAEADLLADLVPGTRVLRGSAATRDAVLDALGAHPCLHFAGHGVNTPEGTLLLLHDYDERPFSAQDVLDRDLPAADLAYLSACEAAQTSVLLPDEATHFGAALSVAGYRHVIGTLWRVDDGVAVEAARNFYGRLADSATFDPALALHETVRELRAAYPSMPGLWAAHIHIGP